MDCQVCPVPPQVRAPDVEVKDESSAEEQLATPKVAQAKWRVKAEQEVDLLEWWESFLAPCAGDCAICQETQGGTALDQEGRLKRVFPRLICGGSTLALAERN